jgi:hypothetical protein
MRNVTLLAQVPRWLWAASVVIGCLGCNKGPELVPITGRVTYQGRPVKDFAVIFVSQEGGRPCMGQTDQDGKYELLYTENAKGTRPGKNKVYLRYNPTTVEASAAFQGGRRLADVDAIQNKYGDENTTPLVFDIKGSQVLDLDL